MMFSYPIPQVEDCTDKISSAEFVSKFNLLKGSCNTSSQGSSSICDFYWILSVQSDVDDTPSSCIEGCEWYIDGMVIFVACGTSKYNE